MRPHILRPSIPCRWGYHGSSDQDCWEVDNTGISKLLEFDDHESILLAAWTRAGMWLLPSLQDRLTLQVSNGYQ